MCDCEQYAASCTFIDKYWGIALGERNPKAKRQKSLFVVMAIRCLALLVSFQIPVSVVVGQRKINTRRLPVSCPRSFCLTQINKVVFAFKMC